MDKLWAGRFSKEPDKLVAQFDSSITVDSRMWREEIQASVAHARMLGATNIISEEDSRAIITGLEQIGSDIEEDILAIDPNAEDIHTFIELTLTKYIGEAGKKLHTARSRNDQTSTVLRLYLHNRTAATMRLLKNLNEILITLGLKHYETIMPGYTHLQRAQPVTLHDYFAAYSEMFLRDIIRLDDADTHMMRNCPLGSCALAGTPYPTDRRLTADELRFNRPGISTIDGVSDRDFVIELASALAIIMMHLSRFSEEIILWSSSEFNFIELDDAYSTGSSIMPQKKNPDVAELVRGKAGRVFGDLQALLTMMKGLPSMLRGLWRG